MPSGWYCNSNRPVVVSLHGLVLCWMPPEKTAQRGLRSARNQHQIASKLIPGRKSTRTWQRRQAAQATALTVATLMRARRARLYLFEPKLYRIRATESAGWLKAWVFQCHRWTRDVRSKGCFLGEKYKVWTLVEALFLHKQARSVQGGQGELKRTLQRTRKWEQQGWEVLPVAGEAQAVWMRARQRLGTRLLGETVQPCRCGWLRG